MFSRRESISGVAPENSRTTPDKKTSTASTGAASPEATRRLCWVWNRRWASLTSRNTQAISSGSTT
ncbi:hypothetical protein PS720_06376 [Pseudomonas fluorescens]|nr:hypothetical protein PS720_06376 [Pseudomonas fluorescens]